MKMFCVHYKMKVTENFETIPVLVLLNILQRRAIVHGVPEKIAQSLCATILQPYLTESCGFQQNVQKEIVHTPKAI